MGTGRAGVSREGREGGKEMDVRNQAHLLVPMVASQLARVLPSHQRLPSVCRSPHSASHSFFVARTRLVEAVEER